MSFSASSFLKTSSLWTSSVMMTTDVECTINEPTNDTKTTTKTRRVSANGKNQYFHTNCEARRKCRRKPLTTTGRWSMTTGCESFVYILLSLIWHRARYHGLGQRKINAVGELSLEFQKIRIIYYCTEITSSDGERKRSFYRINTINPRSTET